MPKRKRTFVEVAIEVLKETKRPMTPIQICEKALERGLLQTRSKKPEKTMNALLNKKIRARGKESPFVKVNYGLYALASKH